MVAPDNPSPLAPPLDAVGFAEATAQIASLASEAGIHRVLMPGWRDLDDVEAGGSELYAARVAEVWAAAGLDVTMRTSRAQGEHRRARRDGYRVVRRSSRYGVFPATAAEAVVGVGGRYDAVFEAWNGIPFLTPLWFRGPRLAILHHVHRTMWPQVFHPLAAKVGWLVEGTLAPPCYRTTPIITPSPSSRCEIVTSLGLPERNITVVPPGIDDRFVVGGQRAGAPTVLSVGRLTPTKNVSELVRVVAAARERVPGTELWIAGEGYDRPAVVATIERLRASAWVHLLGHVSDDELVRRYQEAWVVASASTAEGWGMTLTEAAACGTPAVVSDIPGHRDAIVDGVTGLLASGAHDQVAKLVSVLSDEERRERLGVEASRRAESFRWSATALAAFRALVGRPVASDPPPDGSVPD